MGKNEPLRNQILFWGGRGQGKKGDRRRGKNLATSRTNFCFLFFFLCFVFWSVFFFFFECCSFKSTRGKPFGIFCCFDCWFVCFVFPLVEGGEGTFRTWLIFFLSVGVGAKMSTKKIFFSFFTPHRQPKFLAFFFTTNICFLLSLSFSFLSNALVNLNIGNSFAFGVDRWKNRNFKPSNLLWGSCLGPKNFSSFTISLVYPIRL